jgi:hypothetical protein
MTLYGMAQYDPTIFDGIVVPEGIDPNIVKDDIIEKCGDLYPYYQVPQRVKLAITRFFAEYYHNFEMMYKALTNEYNPIENTDWVENSERANTTSEHTNDTRSTSDTTTDSGQDYRVTENGMNETTTGSGESHNTNSFSSTPGSYAETTVYTNSYNSGTGTERDRTRTSQGGSDASTTTINETNSNSNVKNATNSGSDILNKSNTNKHSAEEAFSHANDSNSNESFTISRHGNIGVQTTSQIISMELQMRRTNLYNTITDLFEDRICVQVY